MKRFLILLIFVNSGVAAADQEWYNARESLERAKVGTYSDRLKEPVKVTLPRNWKPDPSRVERMKCYPNPADPLRRAIICEKRSKQE